MQACHDAAFEIYDDLVQKNPRWKKIYEPWLRYRDEQFLWFRVAEQTYDNFAFTAKRGGK
jgi:TRAP-type mannitol/chloroaromatic compound transport system substrate-binding protein